MAFLFYISPLRYCALPSLMMRLLILLFTVCFASVSVAQQFSITSLGVEEGLGHSITYNTFQSANGYIWISTDNGLTRFDGVYLRNFTTEDGLRTNFIFDVVERDSSLIIATFGGGLMTYRNNEFKPYFEDTTYVTYPIDLHFYQDKLWVMDRYKHLYYEDGNKFTHVTATEMSIFDDDFVETYSLSNIGSVMYIGTSSGLFSFDGKNYNRFQNPEFTKTNIYNVSALRNGNLLVTNKNQLLEYNVRTNTSTVLFTSSHFSPSTSLLEDHEGNIWMSLINGETFLLKAPVQGTRREVINVMEGIVISHVFEDRERNVWLASYGEGAHFVRSIHVRNYPVRGGILSDILIDGSEKDLIVTTANAGLKFFRQTTGGFLNEVTSEPLRKAFQNKKNIVSAVRVRNDLVCLASDDTFFTWDGHKLDSLKVSSSLIAVLFNQPSRNRVWIGRRMGLAYYEGKGIHEVNSLQSRIIRAIAEDGEGNLLLGTDRGIFVEKGDQFTPLPNKNKNVDPYVNALHTDRKGVTWVGTNSGLGKIEMGQVTLIDFPMTRVRCNSIAEDEKGGLWIGTVHGLLHYDGKYYQMVTTKEGLSQSNVTKVVYQSGEGRLALLTANGVSIVDAVGVLENADFELPHIVVEQVSSGAKTIPYRPTASFFELEKNQRDLKILLSTPLIKNRDKITFSYRLNNEPWMEFNGRELSLKALPYGEINLTIRVQERYMEASEKSITMAVLMPRPYFFTWWFLLLATAALAITVAIIVISYSRDKNQKLLQEIKRLDVEHKALRNLLNPHFLYNAINSIHAFILQNDQRKTLGYLSKFSQLVRLNLELLSSDRVSLEKEIKNISLYLEFEKLRFADKLNYSIEIDKTISQSEVEIPSFIIQPFLENAIWHGLLPREQGGDLLIKVTRSGDRLTITIDDNGVGINTSLKHPKADLEKKTSMGINIMRERIGLLNRFDTAYSLDISDKADLNGKAHSTGTVVTITVPAG